MDIAFTEEKKFVVVYKNMRKIISILNSAELLETICLSFANSPVKLPECFNLQYYDEEFQEFIDLDDLNCLHQARKLAVIPHVNQENVDLVCHSTPLTLPTISAICSNTSSVEKSAVSDIVVSNNNDNSSANDEIHSSANDEIPEAEINSNIDTSESSGLSKNNKNSTFQPWPRPFVMKIGRISPSIVLKMDQKIIPKPSEMTEIHKQLFEEVIKYT